MSKQFISNFLWQLSEYKFIRSIEDRSSCILWIGTYGGLFMSDVDMHLSQRDREGREGREFSKVEATSNL